MAEFWSSITAEPKRSHRFLVSFDLPSGTSSQFLARTFTKPAYTIGATEHQFLDKTYYYPGRVTWSEVTIGMVNGADPDMDAELQAILRLSGYIPPDQIAEGSAVGNPGTPNKADAVNALGNGIIVSELDGRGLALGSYKLNNPFVTNVAYGTLDYGSEDLLNVDITVRYDWAVYTIGS
tara:strand:+ start:932 stop:1468 length:537 start_codon:yes stop_codon:yes gene_type:complete